MIEIQQVSLNAAVVFCMVWLVIYIFYQRRIIHSLEGGNRTLLEQSTTDPLTGASNRRAFENDLDEKLRALPKGTNNRRLTPAALAIFFIDLDRFKQVNDTYGHSVGDGVLQSAARAIQSALRRETDLLYRLGGDEFVVILPGVEEGQAVIIAEKVRTAVACCARDSDIGLAITVSIGVTVVTGPEAPAEVIKRADNAVYRAKNAGSNQFCVA